MAVFSSVQIGIKPSIAAYMLRRYGTPVPCPKLTVESSWAKRSDIRFLRGHEKKEYIPLVA